MKENRPLGWTTLEESKELVNKGLDPNTADMYYLAYTTHADGKPIKKPKYGLIPKSYTERRSIGVGFTRVDYKPCWSLSALLRLFPYNKHESIVLDRFEEWTAVYQQTQGCIPIRIAGDPITAVYQLVVWAIENGKIKTNKK